MPSRLAGSDEPAPRLEELVLSLLWSLWSELGVPGWSRYHESWAVDPEALILFTASIGDSDPRLRDESIAWCARNSRYIAVTRLRNLLKSATPALVARWTPFAAAVNAQRDADWPTLGMGTAEQLPKRIASKVYTDDFSRPALVALRLRAVFGVSARAEILLNFVAHPDVRATAADLADAVHYSKRNVEKELEALRKAGILGAERRRNRLEHFVTRPDSLRLFVAPRPRLFPRWDAIFEVLGALLEHESRPASVDHEVAAIEARRVLREMADAVREGGLPALPEDVAGRRPADTLAEWAGHITRALARGDATSLGWVPA